MPIDHPFIIKISIIKRCRDRDYAKDKEASADFKDKTFKTISSMKKEATITITDPLIQKKRKTLFQILKTQTLHKKKIIIMK